METKKVKRAKNYRKAPEGTVETTITAGLSFELFDAFGDRAFMERKSLSRLLRDAMRLYLKNAKPMKKRRPASKMGKVGQVG